MNSSIIYVGDLYFLLNSSIGTVTSNRMFKKNVGTLIIVEEESC